MATHNGADTIDGTLRAFAGLIAPAGGWKLVIVDNASSDRTGDIIWRWRDALPIECVGEARLGKPYALNAGLECAEGDLVVFADDDVLPEPDWLAQWRRIADAHPGLAIFGGAITPEFAVPPPGWLERTSWRIVLYTETKPGRPDGPMASGEMEIYGPNMAVRAEVLATGIRFDTRMMVGSAGLMGEDTDFVDRVVAGGWRAGFAAGARVRHVVNGDQVTWRWMLKRFHRHGRSMFFFDPPSAKTALPRVFGVPRYLLRRIAARTATLPLILAAPSGLKVMSHLRLIAYDLGAARQARLERAAPPARMGSLSQGSAAGS